MCINLSTLSSGHHQSFFFNFRFSSKKSQSQQKLVKKVTLFRIEFCSKNLTNFKNLKSLNIESDILPERAKNLSYFTKFPADMFLFGVRKNIFTSRFLDAQEMHSCLGLVKCFTIFHFNLNFWKFN